MTSKCPHCECSEIEIDPARGDSICTSCGTVVSEDNIVSEVEFLENSKGGSSAVGQFVPNNGIGRRSAFAHSYHGVFSRDSREITLSNAYKKIKDLCQQLRLKPRQMETSFGFFKLALNRGVTKGRKSDLVIGSCVYITCRMDKEHIMLIEVSDALQVDVYELGRTYLRLSTAISITLSVFLDPSLYVERFVKKLSFGESTKAVTDTAMRLVQRMGKDSMHYGRRPSGICGAALVIAARLHNFNRTISDVIKVVKVHDSTVRKRLTEFGETPSSALTPEQFMTVDLEEQQDPPSFIAARKKEKENIEQLLEERENLDSEFSEIQQEIEQHLKERKKKLRGLWAKYDKEQDSDSQKKENISTQKFITQVTLESIDKCITESENPNLEILDSVGIKPSAASLGLKDTIEECMEIRPSEPQTSNTEILDLSGIDDDEIDSYIMSDREIQFKTDLWMKLNKEYLEELKQKEEREKEEAEQRAKEGKPEKKKKIYNKRAKNIGPANTAGEAIEKMLQEKKLSNKINYDVLRNLKGENKDDDSKVTDRATIKQRGQNYTISEPVEKTEKIQSILQSLTGIRSIGNVIEESPLKRSKLDPEIVTNSGCEKKIEEEDEEEEEEDDEEEDEDENSQFQLFQRRKNEDYYDDDDDYD